MHRFFVMLCLLKCKGHEDKSQRKLSGNLVALMTLGFLYKLISAFVLAWNINYRKSLAFS